MIDTDKYEGHLTGGEDNQTWAWSNWMLKNTDAVAQYKATTALLNDAPLLLAEVKRLRKILGDIVEIEGHTDDGKDLLVTITYGDGYMYEGIIDKKELIE